MPLYQQDLNEMPCAKCGKINCADGDSTVDLLSRCHPAAGQAVSYDRRSGVLSFHCQECGVFVSAVEVAEDPGRPGRN